MSYDFSTAGSKPFELFEIHGKSVTYTPCGHEARQETYDQPAGANE